MLVLQQVIAPFVLTFGKLHVHTYMYICTCIYTMYVCVYKILIKEIHMYAHKETLQK